MVTSFTDAVAAPFEPPLQVTCVILVRVMPNEAGCVRVNVESKVHPFTSVTVTVVLPAGKLFSTGVTLLDVVQL